MIKYLILFIITLFSIANVNSVDISSYSKSFKLDDKCTFHWTFKKDTIDIAVECQTKGWVGIGFSSSGSMKGADLYIGSVDETGKTTVEDYHAEKNGYPIRDPQQDAEAVDGKFLNGRTIIAFTRKLNSCDVNDLKIENTMRVLYAYAENDSKDIGYHGPSHRGSQTITLNIPRRVVPREKDANPIDLLIDGSKFTIPPFPDGGNVLETENTPINRKNFYMEEEGTEKSKVYGFGGGATMTPGRHGLGTTYWCKTFSLLVETKQHIVEVEPIIQKGNEKFVHHMLLYECPVKDKAIEFDGFCHSEAMPDVLKDCTSSSLIAAWAVGGESFSFPKEAGYPIGEIGETITMMEMHYDNPTKTETFTDNSGLRLWTTPTLRKFDAGVLIAGSAVHTNMIVPPQKKEYKFGSYCSSSCTQKHMKDEVTIFAHLFHMHTAGKGGDVRIYRKGTEIEPLHHAGAYDFNVQEVLPMVPERKLHPGDIIQVDCIYDTTSRLHYTVGGYATDDEMCLSFLFHYPRQPLQSCMSIADTVKSQTELCMTYDGKNSYTGKQIPPNVDECYEPKRNNNSCPERETTCYTLFPEPLLLNEDESKIARELSELSAKLRIECSEEDVIMEIPTTCISEECKAALEDYTNLVKGSVNEFLLKPLESLHSDCMKKFSSENSKEKAEKNDCSSRFGCFSVSIIVLLFIFLVQVLSL